LVKVRGLLDEMATEPLNFQKSSQKVENSGEKNKLTWSLGLLETDECVNGSFKGKK